MVRIPTLIKRHWKGVGILLPVGQHTLIAVPNKKRKDKKEFRIVDLPPDSKFFAWRYNPKRKDQSKRML